jgi:hypothetical protein
MKSVFHFNGGPLDGAHIEIPGDDIWIGSIVVGIPSKMKSDKHGLMSGQKNYTYTNVVETDLTECGHDLLLFHMEMCDQDFVNVDPGGLEGFDKVTPAR